MDARPADSPSDANLANDDAVREAALGAGGEGCPVVSRVVMRKARRAFDSGRQRAICTRRPPTSASATTTSHVSPGCTAECSCPTSHPPEQAQEAGHVSQTIDLPPGLSSPPYRR